LIFCSVSLFFINNKYQVLRFLECWTRYFVLVFRCIFNGFCFFLFCFNKFLSIESSQWNWHCIQFIVIKSIAVICNVEEFFVYGRPILRRLAKKIRPLLVHQFCVDYQFDSYSQTPFRHLDLFCFCIVWTLLNPMLKIHCQQNYQ